MLPHQGDAARHNITVVDEGEIDAAAILEKKLIDNHYYAIANKASLTKPAELNVPTAASCPTSPPSLG